MVTIIPRPDSISWEEITDFLHLAFKNKAERGMRYLASYQDVETTKKNLDGDIICLVALDKEMLVGITAFKILKPDKRNRRWHNENLYAYSIILAVHPDYQRKGIGKMLHQKRIALLFKENVCELLTHTAIGAKDVQIFLKNFGAQKIELISSPATNYYAIRFRIAIGGKKYNKLYTDFRFYISALKCVLYKNKNGKVRKFWKLLLNKKTIYE